jgi:hypothetical protein
MLCRSKYWSSMSSRSSRSRFEESIGVMVAY